MTCEEGEHGHHHLRGHPQQSDHTKLADPDATNGQQERYSIDNCWYNDLPMVAYEKGGLIEEEATGGFTPSDMVNLDAISA